MYKNYLSIQQKLASGIWPWTRGPRSRLPLFYKERYCELFMVEPEPVHFIPNPQKYVSDEFSIVQKVDNCILPITFPKEADEGLWGGEGVIEGYRRKKNNPRKPARPRIWRPYLHTRAFYSEILDKWMEIAVTFRTLDLIDKSYGFDYYILKTHERDLCSQLGMDLKKEMLTTIVNRSMYPDDPDKCEEIYQRYKEYLIPKEEIEWLGLTIEYAETKQLLTEQMEEERNKRPLKEIYLRDLVDKLKNDDDVIYDTAQSSSWLSKVNPFIDAASKEEKNKT